MGEMPMYALPSEVPQEGLDRKKSALPDGAYFSDLNNEELSDSMSLYYGKLGAVNPKEPVEGFLNPYLSWKQESVGEFPRSYRHNWYIAKRVSKEYNCYYS